MVNLSRLVGQTLTFRALSPDWVGSACDGRHIDLSIGDLCGEMMNHRLHTAIRVILARLPYF